MDAEIQIVTPPVADATDALDHGLLTLTQAVCQATGDESGWGLGGRFGYGENFENDVFAMHRYCWCQREDCPWCMGCDCPEGSTHFFVDGKEVLYREWMAFYDREVGKTSVWSGPEYDAHVSRADAANARRSERHDPICEFCTVGLFPEKGAVAGKNAPNFWHKKSGLKVWWYKWIGRDMEIVGGDAVNLQAIFSECLTSLMEV